MAALWTPTPERINNARITVFARWLRTARGLTFPDYESLWSWSVTDLEGFWSAIWQFFDVRASRPYEKVLTDARMPGAVWFPGARLNLVDQIFRHRTSARSAIVFSNEAGERAEIGWDELHAQVMSLAASLRRLGIKPGDRVVAYLPDVPQTVAAFLAVASVGAVWSMCSPDMGPVAVLDRFRHEALPEVLDSLVVDLEYLGRESYMPLFVVLRPGVELDEPSHARINGEIIAISEVPRTLSGEKMELPIKKLLLGQPVEKVANPDAMANPASLARFVAFARARTAQQPKAS